jgi:hypothetical protein
MAGSNARPVLSQERVCATVCEGVRDSVRGCARQCERVCGLVAGPDRRGLDEGDAVSCERGLWLRAWGLVFSV